MEVPEKIYINSNLENRTWLIGKGDVSLIEYIRKDTFIKKAAVWITNRYQSNGSYLNANDIEDFEKYMKGEQI